MDVAPDFPNDQIVFLFTGIFEESGTAEAVLEEIRQMEHDKTFEFLDAAMLSKSEDGKLHVTETKQVTVRKGIGRGAVIAGVIGLAFPPSLIASVVAGAGIGALTGRVRDTGIKKDQFQRIAEQIEPGNSAVLVLTKGNSTGRVTETIRSHSGKLITSDFGPDTSTDLATIAAAPPWSDWNDERSSER